MSYKFDNDNEKEVATRNLYTTDIVRTREAFDKLLLGSPDDDSRYLVWSPPSRHLYSDNFDEGASGPFEAIQHHLDLHLDGGWDWLVWDTKLEIGFSIEANTYIYAPLEEWGEERFGFESLENKSSARLREFIEESTRILKARKEL